MIMDRCANAAYVQTTDLEGGLLANPTCSDIFTANLARLFPHRGDQARIAAHLGRSAATISKWFSGDNPVSFKDVDRLADFKGCDVSEFFIDPTKPGHRSSQRYLRNSTLVPSHRVHR